MTPTMARFIESALWVAAATGGLVDPTLVGELERAGYVGHFSGDSLPLVQALRIAPPRAPARPHAHGAWTRVGVTVSPAP